MNHEFLLAHFNRISGAPDAIPRLRRFILDLAVRGKLVEQEPKDEPASGLLKLIEADTRRRKATGTFTEPRNAIESAIEFLPFKVPSRWTWARLIEIAEVSYGFAFESSRFNVNKLGMPLVRIRDIADTDTQAYYEGDFDQSYVVRNGDYLVGMDGDFNVRRWKGADALLNQRVMRIRNWRAKLSAEFLAIPLQIVLNHLHVSTSQTTVKHLSAKQVNGIYLPLPPLPEQYRIVSKVDELMALCDRLESAQGEQERDRDQLTTATIHHLNNGANTEAFRTHARFYVSHLPRLTNNVGQIKQLRENILNLAIRGQLDHQDSKDEPVAKLLKSIQAENVKLQKAKGIRVQKSSPPAESFESETVIPKTWVHAYLQDLAYQITDGTHLTPNYTERGKPFLSAQNVKPFRFLPDKHRLVSSVDFQNYRSNRKPERGDVLLTRVGAGIGEAAVLDSDFEFAFYVSLCLVKIPIKFLSPKYLVLWLNSPEGRASSTARTYGKGASQGNLNLGLIRTFKIPLPPLAEQHRIVAKVDELMALCDRLEAQITIAQTEASRLLESVLHKALNGSRSD